MNSKGEPADAELLESDDDDEEGDEKAAGPAETPRAGGELEGHESRVFKAVFSPVDTGRESQRAGSVLYICPHVFVLHMLLYICVLILLCICVFMLL
jgi:hypothetical protein